MDINDPFYRCQIDAAYCAAAKQRAGKGEFADEDDLLARCEAWIDGHGYVFLTAENAMLHSSSGCKGFYGHLFKPKKNPFMPDLFMFRRDGQCLFVELKIRDANGKVHYRPGQRQMVEGGWWKLATTEEEFAALVAEWEDDTTERETSD